MIDSFINYLEHEKRSSIHTVVAYRQDLEQALAFVSQSFGLDNLEDCTHGE